MALSAEQALALASEMYTTLGSRRPDIAKAERYASGKQPLTFASKEWSKFHQDRYKNFADNWCGVVASAPAERTKIDGFRLGPDTDPLSDDERQLWTDWEVNDGPAQSSQAFETAPVAKRAFALVWGDSNNEPVLSFEHPSEVVVAYDTETRRRRAAIKSWRSDDIEYLTLYTPNEVWKWQRSSGAKQSGAMSLFVSGWIPRQGADDDTWPIANPLGVVPVVELPNRPRLGHGPVSDIEGTMAMQDAINLLWAYLFVAADYASMPARLILGAQAPKIPLLDEDGKQIGERPVDIEALSQGRILWIEDEKAQTAQWDAAKLDVFTDVISVAVKHIGAQTKTPLYLLDAEMGNVDADTLAAHDAPLVAKVKSSHMHYTSPIREIFSLMAMVRGNDKLAQAARTGIVKWRNPALSSDGQIALAAKMAAEAGMPFQEILESIYGKEPKDVQRIMDMKRGESLDPYLASLGAKTTQ